MTLELPPSKIPEDLKKYFRPKLKNGPWILRNSIIWHKKNCMPSSAKNRYTIDYERILFFTKSQKYYFKTQYEPLSSITVKEVQKHYNGKGIKDYEGNNVQNPSNVKRNIIKKFAPIGGIKHLENGNPTYSGNGYNPNLEVGRIKRCVWTINTKPFSEAHFAVFPEELVRQCIDAGCPSEICIKCKKPKIQQYQSKTLERYELSKDDPRYRPARYDKKYQDRGMRYAEVTDLGLSDCGCNAGFESGIVLDMFMGSGTTALVALKHNRRFVGIELNEDYINIAMKRLEPYLYQGKLTEYAKIT